MTNAPFTCDDFDALFPDLVDGTLDGGARAPAESHAESCARCRGLLADLVEIRADASRLPVLKPSHDLWDGIAGRLKAPYPLHPAPQWYHSPARLAAAAAVLMAVTAGVTWSVARQTAESGVIANVTTSAPVSASARVAAAYDADLAELGALAAERRSSLDSATALAIVTNMRVIDDAILRVRAALDANPASTLLSRQLAFAYQQKLSALRRVAELSAE